MNTKTEIISQNCTRFQPCVLIKCQWIGNSIPWLGTITCHATFNMSSRSHGMVLLQYFTEHFCFFLWHKGHISYVEPNYFHYKERSITMKHIFETSSTSGLWLITWLASLSGSGVQSSLEKSTDRCSEVNILAKESLCFLLSARLWTFKTVRYVNFTQPSWSWSCKQL